MAKKIQRVNTAKPEVHPGRKIRHARERLAKRIESWEAFQKASRGDNSMRKPGSLKAR